MLADTVHSLGLMSATPDHPKTLAGTLIGRGGKFGLPQVWNAMQTSRKF